MKRLSTGIYQDRYGIRAIVNIAAGRKEKRFPVATSLKEIKRWRNAMQVKLERLHPQKRAGAIGRGTFSADVRRYLKHLAIASWQSRRSELRAWEAHLGRRRRATITEDHLRAVIKDWTEALVPPKTILNRLRALTAMYHTLDGADAWTPADHLPRPKVPKRRPVYVSPELIVAVERRLRDRDPRTHARFMVLAATFARPVHLKRTTPRNVDLERRVWTIPPAKDGEAIELWLNNDMLAAWTAFIAADAWGDFNSTEYAKQLRDAGWPADVRPYNLKHAGGHDLGDLGTDQQTIANWYGHTKVDTAKLYTGVNRAKIRRASEAIDGRLGWAPTRPELPDPGPTAARRAAVDVGKLTADERKALLRQLLEDRL